MVFQAAFNIVLVISRRQFTYSCISLKYKKNNKILEKSKLDKISDDNLNVSEIMEFVFDTVRNIVEKGENAGYQHFSFQQNVFRCLLSQSRSKSGLCGKGLKQYLSFKRQ